MGLDGWTPGKFPSSTYQFPVQHGLAVFPSIVASIYSRREPSEVSGTGFYRPDVLPATKPTVSKHRSIHKQQIQPVAWPHTFLIRHYMTDEMSVGLNTIIWRQTLLQCQSLSPYHHGQEQWLALSNTAQQFPVNRKMVNQHARNNAWQYRPQCRCMLFPTKSMTQ